MIITKITTKPIRTVKSSFLSCMVPTMKAFAGPVPSGSIL